MGESRLEDLVAASQLCKLQERLETEPSLLYRRDNEARTLLHLAVIRGERETTQWLASSFPDLVHLADRNGNTPLHLLGEMLWLEEGKDGALAGEIGKVLLNNGGSVTRKNSRGETPLLSLSTRANAKKGWIDLIYLLFSYNASPDAQDNNGNTFLHRLAEEADVWDSTPIIEALVESGASLSLRNLKGETPSVVARNCKVPCSREDYDKILHLLDPGN